MTGCGIMSSVWGMILQWGRTIKVTTELPVATRHYRDMTEKLLEAMLNPNKQQHILTCYYKMVTSEKTTLLIVCVPFPFGVWSRFLLVCFVLMVNKIYLGT